MPENISLSDGETFAHYRIIKKIGSGGMGEVFLADDAELDRKVALKFLPQQFISDENAKTRFKREAQAAAKLDHSNIVTIFEVSEYRGRPYFAMQHVEGMSLKDVIKNEKISLESVIDMAIQICEGLREAHDAGIVHRDIKPSNIILDKHNRPKLLDFGLATIQGSDKITKTGSALGTVGYMAPEQIGGGDVDARSDLFSFGVILYELISGRAPFGAEYDAAILYNILHESQEPLAKYRKNISERLQHIVDKALSKDRESRYQSASDILIDLKHERKIINPDWSSTSRELPVNLFRLNRKSRLMVSAAIVFLPIILLLLADPLDWQILQHPFTGDRTTSEKHLAVLPFTSLGESILDPAIVDGLLETITSKLTQLEQFHGSFLVVPASEIRDREIGSASKARKIFGATHAITGSLQNFDNDVRMTLNLVDTKSERLLQSTVIDNMIMDACSMQDSTVIELAKMLEIQLQPKARDILKAGGTIVPEAYHLYLKGIGLLSQYKKIENVNASIDLFQEALGMDFHYALAYAGLGEAYWRKYNILTDPQWEELAIYNSQRAVDENNQLAPVYVTLGLIHSGVGRYEKAIGEFQIALDLDSTNYKASLGLARTYEKLNMCEQAELTYINALKAKPENWIGYSNLGLFYAHQGRQDDALEQLLKAVQFENKGYDAWNDLAAIYYGIGYQDEAREMWERSLEIEQNYPALSNLGAFYFMQLRYRDAALFYEKALELDDYDFRVWKNLASALYNIPGEKEYALDTYKRAAEMAESKKAINPHDAEILSALADCYLKLGDKAKASLYTDQALALSPTNLYIMLNASLVYEHMGKRDMALNLILKVFEYGYPMAQIASLPEFSDLLADSRFKIEYQNLNNEHNPNINQDDGI